MFARVPCVFCFGLRLSDMDASCSMDGLYLRVLTWFATAVTYHQSQGSDLSTMTNFTAFVNY